MYKKEVPVLRYIIINADDFGRHAEINRAVEQGLVHGCLRSATVVPPLRGPSTSRAVTKRSGSVCTSRS